MKVRAIKQDLVEVTLEEHTILEVLNSVEPEKLINPLMRHAIRAFAKKIVSEEHKNKKLTIYGEHVWEEGAFYDYHNREHKDVKVKALTVQDKVALNSLYQGITLLKNLLD